MKPVFITCVICLLLSACKEFIEPSITSRTVQLNAPASGFQSTSYAVNFWWNELEDALHYRLQIVTPDFGSPDALVLDTLVKGDKFSTTLSPGNYTWRIRAENGSTETAYSEPRSFTVVFSSIKNQKVQILAPTNNLLTNQSSITFSWGNLYGATRYQLQADTNGFADESKLVVNQTTPAQQFSYSLNKDQNYQWRIRAENDTAQSQWSTINTFTFDHTPPAVVSLTAPTADQSVSLPVNLQWAASSTAVKYRLYLYKGDSNTAFGNSFPMLLNTTSYTLTQGASLGDRIYWKLTALDAAGNESAPSTIRSFVLQ